jgi:hypothetical protein
LRAPAYYEEQPVDLNQLYFDQQMSLINAQQSPTPELRHEHECEATRIDTSIRQLQRKLGAAAACALSVRVAGRAA